MIKRVRDDVLVEVVAQIPVEACADVPIHRLQLDEDQRQPVHEAHDVRPTVVARRAQPRDF